MEYKMKTLAYAYPYSFVSVILFKKYNNGMFVDAELMVIYNRECKLSRRVIARNIKFEVGIKQRLRVLFNKEIINVKNKFYSMLKEDKLSIIFEKNMSLETKQDIVFKEKQDIVQFAADVRWTVNILKQFVACLNLRFENCENFSKKRLLCSL